VRYKEAMQQLAFSTELSKSRMTSPLPFPAARDHDNQPQLFIYLLPLTNRFLNVFRKQNGQNRCMV